MRAPLMRAAMIMAITASAVVGRAAGGPPGGDASKVRIVGNRPATRRSVQYLKQQRLEQRRAAFVEELKQKHKTTIMLRPPAFEVATAGRPEKGGGAKAPVTIIEFSDYQCPFCQRAEGVVDQVMHVYG